MKGIILAGGSGTRLFPATLAVCKQLLPIFDKPMIYYPLSMLMLSGIREILIISTPQDLFRFKNLFGDGSSLGLKLSYKEQEKPKGIADAFIVGKEFIGVDSVCLILGDNIFYGHDLPKILQESFLHQEGGLIFGYHVQNPKRYGVVEFDENFSPISIEEKPQNPKSSYAVAGLYFYDNSVIEIAENLIPSARGELEITDVNKVYLQMKKLKVRILGRGFAWLDAGTHEALQQASSFVQVVQERQGIKIACIEEIAYLQGYIDQKQLLKLAISYPNEYGSYLEQCALGKQQKIEEKSQKFFRDLVSS